MQHYFTSIHAQMLTSPLQRNSREASFVDLSIGFARVTKYQPSYSFEVSYREHLQ